VKILHGSQGGDVEQVARTSKQFFRVCDCSSLSTHLCLYLAFSCCAYLYILDMSYAQLNICLGLFSILHCSYSLYIHCMLDIVLKLVFNQDSYSSTSNLSLEESRGESQELFTENSASLFGYMWCVVLVCKIVLFSHLFGI